MDGIGASVCLDVPAEYLTVIYRWQEKRQKDHTPEGKQEATSEREVLEHMSIPKAVAHPTHGLDPLGVRSDFLTKSANVCIHRTSVAIELIAPDFIQQLVSSQNLAQVPN